MLELTRVYHFSAGHRLASPSLSPEANAALYGPCHHPHGHNYYLEVTVAGSPDRVTGMAVDLEPPHGAGSERGVDPVGHRTLAGVPGPGRVRPTGRGVEAAVWRLPAPGGAP